MIVTRKLLIPTLAFIAVMFLGFITINTLNTRADIEANEEQNLADKLDIFQERLKSRESFAVGLALEVANNPDIQAAFAAGDRERLTELTLPSYLLIDEQFDVPQHQFHLPPATSFLRLHSLDKFDDDLSSFRFTVLTANAEQRPVSGLEIGRGGLGIRGVAPVSYENEHIGTVEFGLNVDQTLLNSLKDQMDADLQLMLLRGPAEVATFAGATADVQGPTDDLILQASTFEAPIFGDATIYLDVLEGTPAISRISVDDLQYAIISAPVYDFSGKIIGVVEIFADRTAVIANQRQSVVTAVIAALLTITFGGIGLTLITTRILRPIGTLTEAAVVIAEGDLNRVVAVKTKDEIGTLATSFNNMTTQLRNLIGSLEQRVAARTQDLNLAAEIGRQVSQVRNLDELLPQAVQLVRDRFELYQTQIYLVDETGKQLVLQASTGHAGTKLLEAGHTLPIDENSLNGTAVTTKHAVIVADTAESLSFHPNALLPDTRSEMVVPLLVGDKVVGVLDLQSDKPNALTEDNLSAFETLSGQLAIAIQNAALLNERRQTEAQVRERESLMRTIIDATPDWIFAKDIDHRYMLLNKAFADTLQLPPDEVVGKHDLEIGVPEDIVKGDTEKGISGIWPGEREVMDSGQINVIEESAYTPDGQPITLTTVRVPLRDAEGNVSGMVGFIHDITDLKQYERELQEANVRTQEVLESINVPLVISRISDGIVAYVNEPLAEMIRVPREELIGQMTPDFYQDPADREAYLTELREKGHVSNYDLRLKRSDGDLFWALISGQVIHFQGNPAIISSLIDITERQQHEAQSLIEHQHQAAINEILNHATTRSSVDELLQLALDQILGLPWMPVSPEGGVFLKEPGVQSLKLVVHRNLAPQLQVLCAKVPFGHCLCGRAAATGEVQFASCVNDAHDISFEGMAPHGHYNIPLITDDNQNLGVMVFYLEHGHQRDENEVSFLTSAGRTIANIVQRKQAEMVQAKQANELSAVAQVSTAAATILEPNQLLQQVVDLTKEQFDLYHAHLYLLDENKNNLVLTNGAGEIGTAMVAEGRKIALSQKQSLVARAARTMEGVVINDVQAEPGFLPHPLLPETRAELAVPLIAGNEVQGVLDVQADSINRFAAEDINIFTTLASQIAVALQNARRHEEAQRSLDELTRLQRIMVREGWEDYLSTQARPFSGYSFNTKGATLIQDEDNDEAVAVKTKGGKSGTKRKTAVTTPDNSLAIPIDVRGHLIGQIGLSNPDGSVISERKQALINTVVHQVSEALERVRLTAQTQQALAETNEQARRLALLNELSETISRMTTIEDIAGSIMNKAPEILKAKRLSLHLLAEEDEKMLRMVGVAGEVTDVLENELVPLAGSLMAQALEKRQIVAGLPTSGNEPLQAYHVPLYAGERPLGTFDMVIPADAELDEGDRQILLQIASLLGSTLENRRLFNQTKARADRERLLNTITQKIQSTVTMESALQTAVSELGQALKLKKAIIEMSTSKESNGQS